MVGRWGERGTEGGIERGRVEEGATGRETEAEQQTD